MAAAGAFMRNAEKAGKMAGEGAKYTEIADKLGVTVHAVYQYLRAVGVAVARKDRRFEVDDLRLAVREGFDTVQGAAVRMGCSVSTVRMLSKEAGITLTQPRAEVDRRKDRLAEVARMHFLGSCTVAEIAEHTGVKPATARGYLVELGILKTKKAELAEKKALAESLLEKTTMNKTQVAAAIGISPPQLSRLLQREES